MLSEPYAFKSINLIVFPLDSDFGWGILIDLHFMFVNMYVLLIILWAQAAACEFIVGMSSQQGASRKEN